MKFRMRKRKRASTPKNTTERPPEVITVAETSDHPYDEVNESRWALQKVFASHLLKISRKHLTDSDRQTINRRSSLADASSAGDSSTKDKAEEPVTSSFAGIRARNTSFQLACGGGATNSVLDSKIIAEQRDPFGNDTGAGRSSVPCMAPQSPLECSNQHDTSSVKFPRLLPQCFMFGEGCMATLFPDSYNHDLMKPVDAAENAKGGVFETQTRITNFFLSTNPFLRKRPETKRNGIPKFITVVIPVKQEQVQSSCCGAITSYTKNPTIVKKNPVENPMSFDTSILRLEETLKKANLDADIEEQYTYPMHEHRPDGPRHQDRTAEMTSVTSSISTHSSLKFGTSIVKLPPAMAPI